MSLAERGESGQAAMIEHQARMGEVLKEFLIATGWRIVNKTPLPVVCFTKDDLDVPSFLADIRSEQIVWMSEVHIDGASAVRACISSFKTTEAELRDVVDAITRLAAKCNAHAAR
jgi:hypothetical protein